MSTKDDVTDFTRGFMDGIRERCKEVDPEGWAEVENAGVITCRTLKNGDRVYRTWTKEEWEARCKAKSYNGDL